MNKLIHIGFGNIVNTGKIIAIVSPDSAPIKRLVQNAKESGMAIDATQGRKTKAVLVMENNQLVLSASVPICFGVGADSGLKEFCHAHSPLSKIIAAWPWKTAPLSLHAIRAGSFVPASLPSCRSPQRPVSCMKLSARGVRPMK